MKTETKENLNQKLTRLCDARKQAQDELAGLNDAIESARIKLIEDIANGENGLKDNDTIQKLEGKKSRQEKFIQELASQIKVQQEAIDEMELAQYLSDISKVTLPLTDKLEELGRALENIYKLASDYLGLEHALNAKYPPSEHWRGLRTNIYPAEVIRAKCDIWLGKYGLGSAHTRDFTATLGLMSESERRDYHKGQFENARKVVESILNK